MTTHFKRIRMTSMIMVSGLMLSGCIPLRISSSVPLPEAAMLEVPAYVRSDPSEVLLLVQSSEMNRSPSPSDPARPSPMVVPIFAKGTDLISLRKTIRAQWHVEWVVVAGAAAGVVPIYQKTEWKRLEKLCVLATDGLLFDLSVVGWESGFADAAPVINGTQGLMTLSRRDAIVAALQSLGTKPFASFSGPCSISGVVDWPPDIRTRVLEFIRSIRASGENDQ